MRRWPSDARWSSPARMPARSSVSAVGNSSGLVPCHSATTGTLRVAQVGQQLRLDPHVAEQHDGVGVPGLEHRGQRDRLVEAAVHVPEHDVVAVRHRLDHQRLDRPGEERVAEVPDHGADQVGRRAAQPAGQRVGPVAEPARRLHDPLAGLRRDRHPGRHAAEHPRHGALRHLGRGGDVPHGRHAAAARSVRARPPAPARGRCGGSDIGQASTKIRLHSRRRAQADATASG